MRNVLTLLATLVVLGAASSALAEPVWATETVTARRWVDSSDHLLDSVEKNARLDVVFREDGWVRVRLPGRQGYGWLPESKVTTFEPAGATGGDFQRPGNTLPPIQLDLP